MTATLPDFIAWPLIGFTAIIIAVRYKWLNDSRYEVYFNNTLALMFVAQLLREHSVEAILAKSALLTVTAAQQLSLVAMIFQATEFMGFVSLWAKRSIRDTDRRQRRNRFFALVLAIAYLAFATRARVDQQLLEVSGGWDGVLAWATYGVMLVALSVQIFRMCVEEFSRAGAMRQELIVAFSGMLLAFSIGSITLQAIILQLFQQLGWMDTVHYRVTAHGFIYFWVTVAATCFAAIPCVMNVIGYFGWDRGSRSYRRLSTLRDSMVAAVPKVAFDIAPQRRGRQRTMLELHQATVQIRDAILQLREYFGDDDAIQLAEFLDAHAVPTDERREASLALRLAWAVRAKRAGARCARLDSADIFGSRPTTLQEEAAELIKLATWWPLAEAAAKANAVSTTARTTRSIAS